MDNSIIDFIKKQTCANVCLNDDDGSPYCFSCYYSFSPEKSILYFKTSSDSKHYEFMKRNKVVAGTILPDKMKTGEVRGVQFRGEILEHDHPLAGNAASAYHLRFPFALAMTGEVFSILLSEIKLTDNKLGFGKKILWRNED